MRDKKQNKDKTVKNARYENNTVTDIAETKYTHVISESRKTKTRRTMHNKQNRKNIKTRKERNVIHIIKKRRAQHKRNETSIKNIYPCDEKKEKR